MALLSESTISTSVLAAILYVCSGYEVQFHILDDHTAHVHGQPDLPPELTQPKGLLSSMDTARSSKHPLPFCTAFRNSTLPTLMLISDNLLQGAIRTDTTYTIITVAYTDNYEEVYT